MKTFQTKTQQLPRGSKQIIFLFMLFFAQDSAAQSQYGLSQSIEIEESYLFDIVSVDVNDDGLPDVVVLGEDYSNNGQEQLFYCENSPNGFSEAQEFLEFPENGFSGYLEAADLNNDQLVDLIMIDGEFAFWFENFGAGEWSTFNMLHEEPCIDYDCANPSDLRVVDVEGDGDLDIAYLSQYGPDSNAAVWFRNEGEGNFSSQLTLLAFAQEIDAFHLQDLDQDNQLELVVRNLIGGISIHKQNEPGVFQNEPEQTIALSGFPEESQFVDLEQDGDLDIVLIGENVAWLENMGNLFFSFDVLLETEEEVWADKTQLQDIDGDGDLDIVLETSGSLAWSMHIYGNQFTPIQFAPISAQYVEGWSFFEADSDGDLDLAVLIPDFYYGEISFINIYENMPAAPMASFAQNDCFGSVLFNASNAYYPNSTVNWDFGDGTTSSMVHPLNHVFPDVGEYEVSLTVCNEVACDTFVEQIQVNALIDFQIPESAVVGEPVNFEDNSLGITNWTWLFGNDESSIEQNPSYTYDTPGTYNVILYLTNNAISGCTEIFTQTMEVSEGSGIRSERVKELGLSPNPASKELMIHSDWLLQDCQFKLFNTQGHNIMNITSVESGLLDVQGLERGVHLVELVHKDGRIARAKFIKK